MIDYAHIIVKAGNGGAGAVSFLQLRGMRHGKPDGGDGGAGGDVYICATESLNTLEPYRFVKYYKAKGGGRGGKNHKKGGAGEDLIIPLPVGTVVTTKNLKLNTEKFDLNKKDQTILIAKGGEGGKGNSRFKSAKVRSPRYAENGDVGEEQELTLELKLLADVGLIGLPNAGKSTLLSVLTKARPAVAPYPFTTLEPNLGVMTTDHRLPTTAVDSRRIAIGKPATLVLADIPGLIEGASEGKGLGDQFLRHIERTKILVHLIDVSTDSDKQSLRSSQAAGLKWQDYQTVRKELRAYSKELAKKKQIVVFAKCDVAYSESLNLWKKVFSRHRVKVLAISAVTHQGLEQLKSEMLKQLAKIKN